jgi:SAM-dependent methyltransferase
MSVKDIDWNRVWQDKIDAASWNAIPAADRRHDAVRASIAEQFHRDSLRREKRDDRAGWIAAHIPLDRDTTVLDIGPGTGVLSVAISRRVKRIRAIEPSLAMVSVLNRYLQQEKASNIDCIHKKWEDIVPFEEVSPHHVVMASFSLNMRDIQTAVFKMNQLAERYVCLLTFVGNPWWDYRVLWPAVHGREYFVGPDYMDLYNVLYAMGIRANIEIKRTEHVQTFDTLQHAVTFWKSNLGISSHSAMETVTSYLEKHLIEEDGKLISRHDMPTAMIWWAKRPSVADAHAL